MKFKRTGKTAFVSAAVASLFCLQLFSAVPASVSAETVYSAAEITEKMGVGWNLGNSLDSNNSGFSSRNILDYETQWSNPVVTRELIDAVKKKGFNTVRIPVTWYQHISSDGNYTIDSAWMARVKEVVDYAYSNGMYVIINVHHEDWINRSDFESKEAEMETELRAVWRQIATAFADYGQRLIFEGMNEPREVGGSVSEWEGNVNCYNVVNQLNSAFVDTVRSVDSPYRQTRMLMIPDYAASRESRIYSYLTVPKTAGSIDADNDGDDDYVAVSLHAYSPFNFAMGDGDHSDFSSSYESELEDMFSQMQGQFLQQGVPIVLGEFSASNYGYDDARLKWAEAYMRNASEYGIPCVLWDNNVEANNGGEAHGYINRSTYEWYTSGEKVVDMLISTRNSTKWGTKARITYPMYAHNDFSGGSYVNISGDGVVDLSSLNGFASDKEIAVKYSGSILPEFALMNRAWGGWTTFGPYDADKDAHIAYVSYDQITKLWNRSNGEFCYLKLNNKDSIGFSGITLLDIPTQTEAKFEITENPADKTVYPCEQIELSAAVSAENAASQWIISLDNGASWKEAVTASANVSSGNGATSSEAVFDIYKNGISERDTVLFRCDFSNGSKTVSTASARVTVLSRNAAVTAGGEKYSSAELSWQADPFAVSYDIYRIDNGSFILMESCTGTSCTLSGLAPETEYEVIVSAVYSDGVKLPYNYNSVSFTTTYKTVDDMTVSECIDYVNSINADSDVIVLTSEQLRAIERVLEYDRAS